METALNWIPMTTGGPRPDGFALWIIPARAVATFGEPPHERTEVVYARLDEDGVDLLDVWGDYEGWTADQATHYADAGPLPA